MTCKEYDLLLQDLLDGQLQDAQAQDMRAHEGNCPDCAERHQQLALLLEDLQALDEDVQVPAECAAAWRLAIREEAEKKTMKRFPTRARAWAAAAAAVVCLFAGTSLMRQGYVPGTDAYRERLGISEAESQLYSNVQVPYSAKLSGGGATDGMDYGASPEIAYDTADSPMLMRSMLSDESAPMPMATGSPITGGSTPEGAGGKADAPTQKILRSANLRIASTTFDADIAQILSLAQEMGGWIEHESTSGEPLAKNPDAGRYGWFTLRIPQTALDVIVEKLSQIGALEGKDVNAQDISDQYYDTEGRLHMYETQRSRLLVLMESATQVSDLIEIESKLAEVNYQIDALNGTLRSWDRRVDYAEVTVQVTETADKLTIKPEKVPLGERMREGLYDSFNAILTFGRDMAVFAVIAAPWVVGAAVLVGIIYGAVQLLRRRKN